MENQAIAWIIHGRIRDPYDEPFIAEMGHKESPFTTRLESIPLCRSLAALAEKIFARFCVEKTVASSCERWALDPTIELVEGFLFVKGGMHVCICMYVLRHCITLRYITLHCVTLHTHIHYITLPHITLHYIT